MVGWPLCSWADGGQSAPERAPITTVDTRIVPGAVLNISVEGEAEISHAYTVDPKGCVRFTISDSSGQHPQQWNVDLNGKTAADAKALLTASLSDYFKNPEVHVSIARLPGLHVEIAGEVQRPGLFVLPYGAHVSDLLATALTKPLADLTAILVRRVDAHAKEPSGVSSFVIDFSSGATGDGDDPTLQEGDKVYLRKLAVAPVAAELQLVRVVGEIDSTPHGGAGDAVRRDDGVAIPISSKMTLKDVFERVGLKETADRAHIYVGRLDGSTRIVNADRVVADDPEDNISLKPGDLVIVPKRDRSQVFAVLGEVNAPNTFEFKPAEKIRLKQAIARAGDLSKKADHHRAVLSKGYLLDPTRARHIPFDPDLVKKGDQPDMELDAGDAIFINQRKKTPSIWERLLPLALHFLPF
jgi:protein involved in polysaccharide export with SLBB domain